jgi:hypothetical protein
MIGRFMLGVFGDGHAVNQHRLNYAGRYWIRVLCSRQALQ